MDDIDTTAPRGVDEDTLAKTDAELSPEKLARVQSLYDRDFCGQAYELGDSIKPSHRWRGEVGCILVGRIAFNLDATRLANRQHIRAFRAMPGAVRTQA